MVSTLFLLITSAWSFTLKHIEITQIDGLSARSLIRAWHKLHVERRILHDFTELLAPRHGSDTDIYYGAVRHDDIRAIAIGQSNDDKTVLDIIGVAHGPGEIDSACALISDLICVSSTSLRTEKLPARWKYEALFARANASKNLSRPLKP